jgi:choline dehydrogenase-like flavoprotein
LLKEIFSENDYIFTTNLKEINWKKNFTSAIHHVGTCRMANNKEEGVVDANLKVFGIENLYICDGSVFPTAGNVNNGLTIAALAIKLAKLFDK